MVSLRRNGAWAVLTGLVIVAAFWAAVFAQAVPPPAAVEKGAGPPAIDPQSEALVKRMSTYLTSLPSFTVRATNSMQVMLASGEKLDFEAVSDVSVRRPDRMRSHRSGVAVNVDFYYDGKTVTVIDRPTKFFTQTEVPASLDGMVARLQELVGVEVPGADLLYTDVFEGLMADVTHGLYVAAEDIGGAHTHHLAFRGRELDWQIWIEDGDRPLPRRYVITTKWMTGAPQFGVSLNDWNVSPRLEDTTFVFAPPVGARKVDLISPAISPGGR